METIQTLGITECQQVEPFLDCTVFLQDSLETQAPCSFSSFYLYCLWIYMNINHSRTATSPAFKWRLNVSVPSVS